MPDPNPAALEFLLSRRSRPAKTLGLPVPTPEQLMPILTAASRSPDHGKLEPWRFIVLQGAALRRLGNDVRSRATAMGLEAEQADKGAQQFETGHLAVAVIEVRKPTDKIPELEQTYAVGGVCLALLNAALASGWGANWLSGWPSHDRGFMMQALGLAPHERIAGFIHIGTETSAPPDRPRPDLDQIVTWHSA
jgi:nitroreductase